MDTSKENNAGKLAPNLEAKIGEILERITRFFALLGGFTLVALVLLILVNVIGRFIPDLGFRPIRYDYELIQAGTPFAFFAFLPWSLLHHGRVAFGAVVRTLGPSAMGVSTLINSILIAIISSLIFAGTAVLTINDIGVPMPTLPFYFPSWLSTAGPALGAFLLCLVAYYCVWRSANELTGRNSKP